MIDRTNNHSLTIFYKGNSPASQPISLNNGNGALSCYPKYNATVTLTTFSMKEVSGINAVYVIIRNLPSIRDVNYYTSVDGAGIGSPIFASIPNNSINGSNITYIGNEFTYHINHDGLNQLHDLSFSIKNDLGYDIENTDYCLTLVFKWQTINVVPSQEEFGETMRENVERVDRLYEMNY